MNEETNTYGTKNTNPERNEKLPTISIRRPRRQYHSQISWGYEMKIDLYKCYTESKPNEKNYMNRLKCLWDNVRPEYNHLNSKTLRDRVSRIITKKEISELRISTEERGNNERDDDTNEIEQKIYESRTYTDESISTSNEITNDARDIGHIDFVDTSKQEKEIPKQNIDNENANHEMETKLQISFYKYYEQFKEMEANVRPYQTKIDRKIPNEELLTMNNILKKFFEEQQDVDTWIINVAIYSSAVVLLERQGKLKLSKEDIKPKNKPGWLKNFENQINAIRRKLSHIDIIQKSDPSNNTNKHQRIKNKIKKFSGNLKADNLKYHQSRLKHELKVITEKMRRRKLINERATINKSFRHNPKKVYQKLKNEEEITVKDPPTSGKVTEFWQNIWGKSANFNEKAKWIPELEENYCKNAESHNYQVTENITNMVIQKMPNNKAPGFDLVTMFWYKKLDACVRPITQINKQYMETKTPVPDWLPITRTIVIPKNKNTSEPKNYRPIACENNQFKIYTGTIAYFLNEHCKRNNIIFPEQTANKTGSWGCIDQLMINKHVTEEISKYHRSAFFMWLDYQKAYDSVSHKWIIKSLKLAKVPPDIIEAIFQLTKLWEVKINLKCHDESIETEKIKYLRGMLQGDLLSVILFLLCLNPLSHLINKCEGYKMGEPEKRNTKLTHLFFVDDLKLFGKNQNDVKQQLDIITEFSHDIGMKFGEDKCAFINIEKGKQKLIGHPIQINGVKIQELAKEKTYKYLGLDESTSYDTELNKEKISKEYIRRIRKIWSSQLNGFNKIQATNSFAVPMITYSFGIVNWTKENLKQLNIKTRKIMNMNRSLNRRSDVDRLYVPRKYGGRGLRNLEDEYIAKIPTLFKHLCMEKANNKFIYKMLENKNMTLNLVATSIAEEYKIDINLIDAPKKISYKIKNEIRLKRKDAWLNKPIHGYLTKCNETVQNLDKRYSWSWMQSNTLTSEVESYICTLQEQEIFTNNRKKMHEKNPDNKRNIDANCRLCKENEETVEHILTSCPKISASLYLNQRHDYVGKFIYDKIMEKYNIKNTSQQPLKIVSNESCEIWWDQKVNLPTGVKHNKPDIILWNKEQKTCQIIEISVPSDRNINKKIKEKYDNYYPLIGELQRVYPEYKYRIIPIIVGALGSIPTLLERSLIEIGFETVKTKNIIKEIQKRALLGSLKIMKTFMKTF